MLSAGVVVSCTNLMPGVQDVKTQQKGYQNSRKEDK